MVKEKAVTTKTALPSTREDTLRQVGKLSLWALLGLLCARTAVYGGMAPFGVGAAAAAGGVGALFVYIATAVGYLLSGSTVVAMRYLAAVVAVAGIRWSLGGLKQLSDSRLFAPLNAAVSLAATGLALSSVSGLTAYTALMLVGESVLGGGFAYFIDMAVDTLFSPKEARTVTLQQQAAVVITLAAVLMSVSSLTISGISPGRILTVLAVLLCARCGREQGGCIAGVVMGTAVALGGEGALPLAIEYAFGGLLGGMFARFGRLATAGVFFGGSAVVALACGTTVDTLVGMYEIVAGGLLFLVVPPRLDKALNAFFSGSEEKSAVEGLRRSVVWRLDVASKAMAEVAGTVDAVSKKLAGVSAPDLGGIYFGVSDSVCRQCGLRMVCWEKEMSDTMDSFNHLTPLLRQNGKVEYVDFDGRLPRRCTRLDEVINAVNRGYAEHRLREGAWRRLSEIRAVVTDQFSGMAELLSEFAEDFAEAERVDADAAARVKQVCEEYHLSVEQAVCTVRRGNRMQVEILAADTAVKWRREDWLSAMDNACGREFAPPKVVRLGETISLSLTEKPRYRVRVGSAQLCNGQERLCGDAFETFESGDGHLWAVLSDGMGSGGRAAVDGAMAAGLTARLLEAGFGEDSVLRMVNSALMVKSGDESLATLDVLSVDLFTGRMVSLKAGAAASLLCSHGRVSRLERSSLPVGILRDIAFEKQTDTLTDGDIVLLVSDGALCDGIGWVEQVLADFDGAKSSLQSLAERIACAARERQEEHHQDDITVLALRVEKASH